LAASFSSSIAEQTDHHGGRRGEFYGLAGAFKAFFGFARALGQVNYAFVVLLRKKKAGGDAVI